MRQPVTPHSRGRFTIPMRRNIHGWAWGPRPPAGTRGHTSNPPNAITLWQGEVWRVSWREGQTVPVPASPPASRCRAASSVSQRHARWSPAATMMRPHSLKAGSSSGSAWVGQMLGLVCQES